MNPTVEVVLIAAGLAALVGVAALALIHFTQRRSLRWSFVIVAISGVLGVVAGLVGTARAMFLSAHDFKVSLWIATAAGLVSLCFALVVARISVRGFRAVQEATRSFGENGAFEPPKGTSAELSAVSAQLAETSARLAESRERERALEASRRELVVWVSHDLRTPLAGLRAMAEALEDGIAEDPNRYHQQMRETVDRIAQLVDDLFELARVHSGSLQLSLELVSLEDAVSDALVVGRPLADATGVGLTGVAEPGVAVRADPRELARVMENLVTNAIRHTPSEGTVALSARTCDGAVEFAVRDACGGIPQTDLERVFDVAWRGSHARTPDASAGSGLGLAIVRGIVDAHHGTVRVDNVGDGCRFLVRLPAAAG